MIDFAYEMVRSVEHIWLIWIASLAALAWLGRAMIRRHKRRPWRELARCEDGIAYSLSYMITVPLLAFIVCLIVDTTLILVAKTGTVYAAYAAGRSAIVWFPSGVPNSTARDKMETAAIHALTPFASGSKQHRPPALPSSGMAVYLAAHKAFSEKPAKLDYLGFKYLYASWATDVTTDAAGDSSRPVVTTVTYKAPFHMPGIGRLLGIRSAYGFYYMNVTTTIRLESQAPRTEGPASTDRPLGITYVPSTN